MALMQWSLDLMLRTKNSAGTPLHFFIAYGSASDGVPPIQPVVCGPITPGEKIQLEREGLDWSEDPLVVGVRYRLPVRWEERAAYVRGSTARSMIDSGSQASTLGTILTDLFTVGNYLEVSVNGGTTWRVCYVDSEIDFKTVTGKNVSVGLEITFAQKAVRQVIAGVAAGDW